MRNAPHGVCHYDRANNAGEQNKTKRIYTKNTIEPISAVVNNYRYLLY